MKSPGMDPYLEHPKCWPGVHSRLVVYIGDFLGPQLEPKYVASVEERVYVEGPNRDIVPDVLIERAGAGPHSMSAVMEADSPVLVAVEELEIRESYIEILDINSDMEVVTVIEVVSPTNKTSGPGRDSYLRRFSTCRQSWSRPIKPADTNIDFVTMSRVHRRLGRNFRIGLPASRPQVLRVHARISSYRKAQFYQSELKTPVSLPDL